jgi:signal transduction histidine kinase
VASLRRVVLWWTILYGTGAAGLEIVFSRHAPSGATPAEQAIKDLIYALVWAPVLLGAIALTEWRPVPSPVLRRANLPRLALHGAALLAAPLLWGAAAYYLRRWAIPRWHPPAGVTLMWASTAGGILYVYGSVVIVCHLLLELQERQRRDAARLRVAEGAADAQLQVLLLELHPHFLGNALQAVSDLLRVAPDRAVGALAALRELLANALRAVREQRVTLADELRTLRCYLTLQALRYGDRLRVLWDVPESTHAAWVPAFILQPLVENAIKHSLDAVREPLEVTIRVRPEAQWLDLSVLDTGIGLPQPHRPGLGTPALAQVRTGPHGRPRGGRGLRNVQDRLHHLYGTAAGVQLQARADRRGAVATVRLPYPGEPTPRSAAEVVPLPPRTPATPDPAGPATATEARDGDTRRVTTTEDAGADAAFGPAATPLVRRAATWKVLIAWHAVYAVVVWLIDALIAARLPGRSPGAFAPMYRVLQVVLWIGILAVALGVAERWPVRSLRDGRRVLAQVGLGLGVAVGWGVAAYLLGGLLDLWWSGRSLGTVMGVEAKGVFFAYAVAASLLHLLVNLRAARVRDLAWRVNRQRLADARVRLLALNLQSAGVLETLDHMTARAASDPVGTNEGVIHLADVLHGYLDLARRGHGHGARARGAGRRTGTPCKLANRSARPGRVDYAAHLARSRSARAHLAVDRGRTAAGRRASRGRPRRDRTGRQGVQAPP